MVREKKNNAPLRREDRLQHPEYRVERIEGTNPSKDEAEKYRKQANKEAVTRVTRQEQGKKATGNKDCGDSNTIKSMEDAKEKDPSLTQRIANMVKKW